MLKEIEIRKDYLGGQKISTIYFGGGTPSLLSGDELNRIFDKVYSVFHIDKLAEITLEANPDDLTSDKLKALKSTPINRFSIGVQSFSDRDLKYMNRAHSSSEALSSVKRSQDAGFGNISIDLIYGTPGLVDSEWKQHLHIAADLDVKHLSCYALTVEKGTPLDHFIKRGKSEKVSEKDSAEQFEILMDWAPGAGFIQYEISNFGKENYFSKHNSSYWSGAHYLGLGPSAHSFDGVSRQWNIANNPRYADGINSGKPVFEKEELSEQQMYNEYIMTSLRTTQGFNLEKVDELFGSVRSEYLKKKSLSFLNSGMMELKNSFLVLTHKGKFFADRIASDLFSD